MVRRLKKFRLFASGKTTRLMSETEKRQHVVDQMSQDPTSKQGPRTVKEALASKSVHLTRYVDDSLFPLPILMNILGRDYIHSEMKMHDPEGFKLREPHAKKVRRFALVSLGRHHEWSGDGHDKLAEIGFPIWAMRDVWSAKWLGIWVVPNNRLKVVIAYLYLSLVHEYGGTVSSLSQ